MLTADGCSSLSLVQLEVSSFVCLDFLCIIVHSLHYNTKHLELNWIVASGVFFSFQDLKHMYHFILQILESTQANLILLCISQRYYLLMSQSIQLFIVLFLSYLLCFLAHTLCPCSCSGPCSPLYLSLFYWFRISSLVHAHTKIHWFGNVILIFSFLTSNHTQYSTDHNGKEVLTSATTEKTWWHAFVQSRHWLAAMNRPVSFIFLWNYEISSRE